MKIINNLKWFPFGKYTTINLFGILFTKHKILSRTTILHEQIHTAQMRETLYIFFYVLYVMEYVLIRFFHKSQNGAYHDISFEEEAYANEHNYDYLKNRKHYTWFKYLKIKSYVDNRKQ